MTDTTQNITSQPTPWPAPGKDVPRTARLVLADGSVIEGIGLGAEGQSTGEVCFNTAMTGYQEILTDPSYTDQIITFTFPHIGNIGTNEDDVETTNKSNAAAVRGCVLKADITEPSNYRARAHLECWLKEQNIIAISGIDTRALTKLIRESGMPNAVIAHNPNAEFDLESLKQEAKNWPGIEGADLAAQVTCQAPYDWNETSWRWGEGYRAVRDPEFKVVAVDFGAKRNILRCLADVGADITIVPAGTTAEDIMKLNPDGVFLSNGPGDPAATGEYAVPVIKEIVATGTPVFGICLGHQMLAIALGASTSKMAQGHHGANHPVKDHSTDKVEITSMNHGFTVDRASLPDDVEETHVSLFDDTNCGLRLKGKPVFSVQYHPEASPGPRDSHYLFERFAEFIREHKKA